MNWLTNFFRGIELRRIRRIRRRIATLIELIEEIESWDDMPWELRFQLAIDPGEQINKLRKTVSYVRLES